MLQVLCGGRFEKSPVGSVCFRPGDVSVANRPWGGLQVNATNNAEDCMCLGLATMLGVENRRENNAYIPKYKYCVSGDL